MRRSFQRTILACFDHLGDQTKAITDRRHKTKDIASDS